MLEAYRKKMFYLGLRRKPYLLNNRFLLLVKRSNHSRVNPDKFSLFTGRSDNLDEKLNPLLISRELFEELLLFNGNRLYKPICTDFQSVINKVYLRIDQDIGIDMSESLDLPLEQRLFDPKETSIASNDYHWRGKLNYHINSKNEVNILFLFAANIQIDTLSARDGEYFIENGQVIFADRSIYLYDILTSQATEVTHGRSHSCSCYVPKSCMTEHTRFLLDHIKV